MPDGRVLVVEDDDDLRSALCATLGRHDFSVSAVASGPEALELMDRQPVDVVVTDVQMEPMNGCELLREIRHRDTSTPAILMTGHGTVEQAVDAMRLGASDYLVKPVEADLLVPLLRQYLDDASEAGAPIAVDPQSVQLLAMAKRIAASEATVTISGESGSGKEVIARYIHDHSPRRDQPFVAINCAAIPENMLEAVLFGYEKGAFTGAVSAHPGKFEQAQGGTLLLDEVSEMDIGLQAKLLRVIQEREVERLGGRRAIALNVRVLATTNRDLKAEVAASRFREDLYYRLNVFPLRLRPLRERPADILPLAECALDRYRDPRQRRPTIGPGAQARLLEHRWPGNVRELNNLVQRSTILLSGSTLDAHDLLFEAESPAAPPLTDDSKCPLQQELQRSEQQIIVDALVANQGDRRSVASALGISPRTLRYKLAKLKEAGVDLPFVRGAGSPSNTPKKVLQ